MQGCNRGVYRTKFALGALLLLAVSGLHAENVLSLKRSTLNAVSVELSSEDAIAGFQFSVNTRGGISIQSFTSSERLQAAGISVFQHSVHDSTLNVVLLAPVRAALPKGTGTIGTIRFTTGGVPFVDTLRFFLTGIAVCNVNAQMLAISATPLTWSESQYSTSPAAITLEQNFPNPFNPSTTISYLLEHETPVRLAVYDITGREVALLVNQRQSAGRYSVQWNVQQGGRIPLSSGLYFAHLTAGSSTAVSKMVLAK
jgi:hypothetical protein